MANVSHTYMQAEINKKIIVVRVVVHTAGVSLWLLIQTQLENNSEGFKKNHHAVDTEYCVVILGNVLNKQRY